MIFSAQKIRQNYDQFPWKWDADKPWEAVKVVMGENKGTILIYSAAENRHYFSSQNIEIIFF